MAKKESSDFYHRKAMALRSLGIEAQPVTEQVVVSLDYNDNQVKALAESKGQSLEDFMAEIDKVAHGDEDAVMPGTAKLSTREQRAAYKDQVKPATEEVVEEPKAKAPKKKATPKKTAAKAEPAKEVDPVKVTEEVDPKDSSND